MIYQHLYVHIPFCQRRCSYCDFNTFANSEGMMEAYCAALAREIRALGSGTWSPEQGLASPGDAGEALVVTGDLLGAGEIGVAGAGQAAPRRAQGITAGLAAPLGDTRGARAPQAGAVAPAQPAPHRRGDLAGPLRRADLPATVFVGGGTPTALPVRLLEQVLRACDDVIPLSDAEVTSEANPGTVLDEGYLRAMRAMGINRISMGVQSLDDAMLRTLGRIHTAAEARASYEAALRAGFESINLDFIFGLPGQTLPHWRATLDEVARWGVPHLSLYSLIVEEGTPLAGQVAGGQIAVPDDDESGAMYELAMERLDAAGYVQYEISNWALPGAAPAVPERTLPAHACLHNVAYWLNADYLGCGAGAHSHAAGRRWSDLRALGGYARAVEQGGPPVEELIALGGRDLEAETMLMGLRLSTGVGRRHFAERCGRSLEEAWGAELAELAEQGLAEQDEHGVRLTARGRMVANGVFLRFL